MKTQIMHNTLLAAGGGFFGAGSRYLVYALVDHRWPSAGFPTGTLVVNVVGCFLIGLLMGYAGARAMPHQAMRVFLVTGILGGFTTFSAFSHDSLELARSGDFFKMALNIVLHLVLGLAAAWGGFELIRLFVKNN